MEYMYYVECFLFDPGPATIYRGFAKNSEIACELAKKFLKDTCADISEKYPDQEIECLVFEVPESGILDTVDDYKNCWMVFKARYPEGIPAAQYNPSTGLRSEGYDYGDF